jgi:cytochrome c5
MKALLLTAVGAVASLSAIAAEPPKSVKIDLSDPGPYFSGPGAEAMNANCTACHSAEMVHTQPALSKATWQAEVTKMQKVYKATLNEEDIPAILDYLTRLKTPPS